MGRYWLAVGTSWPAVAGRRTELMSLVPSRPVDRPPLGGPACCSGSKGGFSLTACRKESPYLPGELAKLADRRRAVPVPKETTAGRAARLGHRCGHRARHPPTAPRAPVAVLEPSPRAAR